MSKRLMTAMTAGLASGIASLCLAGNPQDIFAAAGGGQIERIDALLRADAGLVNARDASGCTPMHFALRNLRVAAVRRLLERGADLPAGVECGGTALHVVMLGGDNTKEAQEQRETLTGLLLDRHADVGAADDQGKTPLHLAAVKGRKEVLDPLLAAGAKVGAQDRLGRTPLHDAAMFNQITVIHWLLSKRADVGAEDIAGDTPLHVAVLRFRREATERLIEGGAAVNARNKRAMTPLHIAATAGPDEKEVDRLLAGVAEVLLTHGADVNAVDVSGATALKYALEHERKETAAMLRRHGAREPT